MSAEDYRAQRGILWATAVFIIVATATGFVVLPADAVVTIDGYFHFKISQMISSQGPWVDVSWLPLTVLGDEGPDHHWLWHVLLVPFTWLGEGFMGLKWASVLTAAAVPAALCLLLHRMGVPWPGVFAALAWAGALIMPGRLLMLRAQNVAIVGIALALWCLATRRHRLLALVSFAMMQAYHGAVLLLPLAVIDLGIRRVREEVWTWKPLLAVVVGLCAGLLLSPWFPENVDYLLFHTLYKLTNPQHLAVGSEWQSPSLNHLLKESWPVLVCLALAIFVRARRREGWPGHEVMLWAGATALCLLLYMKAWRFAEYFVPMGAICAALLIRQDRAETEGTPESRPPPDPTDTRWVRALLVITVICVTTGGWMGMKMVADRAEFEPGKYGELAEALGSEAQEGDLVFNRAWEDFVFLFWQRPDLRYVTGLDPNYLAYEDPARFQLWMWIRGISAEEPNDPAPLIREVFGARWVVVDHHGQALAARLKKSPFARLVRQTRWGWLYEIQLPDGGDPTGSG